MERSNTIKKLLFVLGALYSTVTAILIIVNNLVLNKIDELFLSILNITFNLSVNLASVVYMCHIYWNMH